MHCVKLWRKYAKLCTAGEGLLMNPYKVTRSTTSKKAHRTVQTNSAALGCKEKSRRLHLSSKRQDAKPSQMPSRQLKPWMCPAIDNLFNFSASVKMFDLAGWCFDQVCWMRNLCIARMLVYFRFSIALSQQHYSTHLSIYVRQGMAMAKVSQSLLLLKDEGSSWNIEFQTSQLSSEGYRFYLSSSQYVCTYI